jgi:hypothetical protein
MEIKTGDAPMSTRQENGYRQDLGADRPVEIRIKPDDD